MDYIPDINEIRNMKIGADENLKIAATGFGMTELFYIIIAFIFIFLFINGINNRSKNKN